MHEVANQKVLDRQLEQLEEAKAFAIRTLGKQKTDHTLSKRWLFGMSKSTARN